MTNADKIKSMNTYELAKFINNVGNNSTTVTVCTKECNKCECSDEWCVSEIADWLMSEAEDE